MLVIGCPEFIDVTSKGRNNIYILKTLVKRYQNLLLFFKYKKKTKTPPLNVVYFFLTRILL